MTFVTPCPTARTECFITHRVPRKTPKTQYGRILKCFLCMLASSSSSSRMRFRNKLARLGVSRHRRPGPDDPTTAAAARSGCHPFWRVAFIKYAYGKQTGNILFRELETTRKRGKTDKKEDSKVVHNRTFRLLRGKKLQSKWKGNPLKVAPNLRTYSRGSFEESEGFPIS